MRVELRAPCFGIIEVPPSEDVDSFEPQVSSFSNYFGEWARVI
jgi:hypothetical protein